MWIAPYHGLGPRSDTKGKGETELSTMVYLSLFPDQRYSVTNCLVLLLSQLCPLFPPCLSCHGGAEINPLEVGSVSYFITITGTELLKTTRKSLIAVFHSSSYYRPNETTQKSQ